MGLLSFTSCLLTDKVRIRRFSVNVQFSFLKIHHEVNILVETEECH